METLSSKKERILVIQTAFIGDAILTLPMIQKLKEIDGDKVVDVLCIPTTEGVFLASPFVDNVLVIDKKGKQKGFRKLNKFIRELKEKEYFRIYSPHRSFRSAYITMNLGSRLTYGFNNSSFKYAYKNLVTYIHNYHEVQRNLSLIDEDVQNDNWKILPVIRPNANQKRNVDKIIAEFQIRNTFIMLAPGSVWKTKRYSEENYDQVIRLLIDNGEQIILIGGHADELYCNQIKSKYDDRVISLAGKLSIIETIYLMAKTKLLITNDSAPTHMGMCADIPVLTLYCSTIPEIGFYPYNNKSSVLSFDDLDCKPCGIHGHQDCPIKSFDCSRRLSPLLVVKEAKRLINENEKRSANN